jgi:hypothetical protein
MHRDTGLPAVTRCKLWRGLLRYLRGVASIAPTAFGAGCRLSRGLNPGLKNP